MYEAYAKDTDAYNWTYLPYGPFDTFEGFNDWLVEATSGDDPLFHTIFNLDSGAIVGLASYLRINPNDGVIEVGHIHFSPLIQRSTIATETMFLMMKQAFELGYRRYEWKCDALNDPSCKAAMRLGFEFEGIFRQLTKYKNRNRDTAWFAILDQDWPALKSAFEQWLSTDNFDDAGKQKKALGEFVSS